MYRILLAILSLVTGLINIATGVAMWLVYVIGVTTIMLPGVNYNLQLITMGIGGLLVYGVANVLDAIYPQESRAWNRVGKVTSFFALGAIASALAFSIAQLGMDVERIKAVFLRDGSMILLAGVCAFALFDVLVLQQIKNASLRRNSGTFSAPLSHAADAVVTDPVRVSEALRSFGITMHGCQVAVVDARGRDLLIKVDDNVEIRTISPADAAATAGEPHAAHA